VAPLPSDGATRPDRRSSGDHSIHAIDVAMGRSRWQDDKAYLAQIAVLREEATRIDSGKRPGTGIAPDQVVAKLRALPETWAKATPEGRAELLHSIYERIVVRGPEFVGARLTPEAYSLGLALALPERVQPAQAGSTGAPDRSQAGDATMFVRVPIAPRPW
jgi:hypothetical protein